MSVNVEHSVIIQRSASDVFSLIGNPNDDPNWGSLILESEQVSSGPFGVGTTFHQIAGLLGARITMRIEVTALEPGRLLRYRASEPFTIAHRRQVEETPDGARLTFSAEIEPQGKYRVATPLIREAMRRQIESDLDSIKTMLEYTSPDRPSIGEGLHG
jgi:hypothetical protein